MAKKKVNVKNIYIALGFIVVLGGYLLFFDNSIEESKKNKNKLFKYTLADVSKFEIQKADSVISLKRDKNDWKIIKPRQLQASKSDVEIYLQDVKDLEIKKKLGTDVPDLKPYGLDAPKFVFKVWLGNNKLLTLNVGNQNPDKSGYYAKFENRPDLFLLDIIAESTIDKDLMYFRYKDIIDADINKIEKFTISVNNENYIFTKKDNQWNIVSPVEWSDLSDSDSVRFLTTVKDLKVKTYYDDSNKVSVSDAGLLNPQVKIVLTDTEKHEYSISIGKEVKDKSEYYARKDDEILVFGVDKYTVDNLQKDLTKLKSDIEEKIKKKKEEEKKKAAEEKAKKNNKKESEKNEK